MLVIFLSQCDQEKGVGLNKVRLILISVLIQGRDNLELGSGTTFELTSSSPANVAYRQ